MHELLERTGLRSGMRVLDVGGTPDLWRYAPLELDITLLNLPGAPELHGKDTTGFSLQEADFTQSDVISGDRWDFVFSNSVIEHVGDAAQRRRFANNVINTASAWWVQVPAPDFPVEAHCHMPGWWRYPPAVQNWFINRWQNNGRAFRANQMRTTHPVYLDELQSLFAGASIFRERIAGFTKSVSVYRAIHES